MYFQKLQNSKKSLQSKRSLGSTDLLRDHLDLQSEGLRDDEDVGEDDGGVEGEPADGLQRDLGGELGRAADLEELVLLAELAELGEVAAGLPHHPHRRPLHGLAAGRPKEEVVLQGGKLRNESGFRLGELEPSMYSALM